MLLWISRKDYSRILFYVNDLSAKSFEHLGTPFIIQSLWLFAIYHLYKFGDKVNTKIYAIYI